MQRCSRCILQTQVTGLKCFNVIFRTIVVVGTCPSAEMLSLYFTATADWVEMVKCHLQDTRWGSLTPLHRCSQCILQPQPTGPEDTRWRSLTSCRDSDGEFCSSSQLGNRTVDGRVLPFCWAAISVFYDPNRLCWDGLLSYAVHSLGESYPSAQMQSVYSASPANWTTGHSLGESYPSAEMQSVLSRAPANWTRKWLSPCLVLANVRDCSIEVSKFKLQLHCYVHFQTNTPEKGMSPLNPPLQVK